jgi:hypothetical protein
MITRDIILSNFFWLINSQIAIDIISLEFRQTSSYLKLITLYLRKYLEEEHKLYDKIIDNFESLEQVEQDILNNHTQLSREQVELINKYYNNENSNYSINEIPIPDIYMIQKLYNIFYNISLDKINKNTYLPILVGLNIIFHLHPYNITI